MKKLIKVILEIFGDKGDAIDRYTFKSNDDTVIQCAALHGARKYKDAIRIYEKFENMMYNSDLELVGLTTILKVCDDPQVQDNNRLEKYGKRLEILAPDHPFVIALKKRRII